MTTNGVNIPEFLRYLFWDTDFTKLDAREHKEHIISRILEYGNIEAYRWLFRTYSEEEIAEVVKNSLNISPPTAYMMANVLDIPLEEIRCLRRKVFPEIP
ncbi:DUF6922 domain-containing protein [Caldicellulosiruptor acetigenus]|uniref:DUF6922 domain-containing protein n=1 Tax=Caldicellulosiruptor acetigenus TaxID=301953 RepID=UPI0004928C83|nr:hypothetical protein [Caldicellulosiruptor acetigenus]WAM36938.1 hypothetical protein OTK01_000744 [Caldicellulosiruptor acetigenus]